MSRDITDEDFPLYVTSFYGGKERGRCLQFSAGFMKDYTQLTRAQVERLVLVLNEWLAEEMRG